jgi:hypothetical protein
MSFDVRPPEGPGTYDATGRVTPAPPKAADARFSRVYELEAARRRREIPLPEIAGDRIPDDVWDEVDAAARLVEQLETEGKRMMFDTDRLSGRVVASLLHPDGAITPVALTDAVSPAAVRRAADGSAEEVA